MSKQYATQCDWVLSRVMTKKGITSLEAMLNGVGRLASRIKDLRKLGYNITTNTVQHGRKRYARYTLEG